MESRVDAIEARLEQLAAQHNDFVIELSNLPERVITDTGSQLILLQRAADQDRVQFQEAILGLQRENQRILQYLFGEDQRN